MRFKEIMLESDHTDMIKNEIISVLSMSQAHGITELSRDQLLADLTDVGLDLDDNTLDLLLDEIPTVTSHDSETISIGNVDDNEDHMDFGVDDEMDFDSDDEFDLDDESEFNDGESDPESHYDGNSTAPTYKPRDTVGDAARNQAKKGIGI